MAILKFLALIAVSVIVAIPPAFFAALACVPLLRAIERRWPIEVIGHSGPADWVLWTIWIVISLAIAVTISMFQTKRGAAE